MGIFGPDDGIQRIGNWRDAAEVAIARVPVAETPRPSPGELSELVGHGFHREDVSTVGGLVYEVLGRVPRAGEELVFDGFRLVVEKVVHRRVTRVFVERLPSSGNGNHRGAGL